MTDEEHAAIDIAVLYSHRSQRPMPAGRVSIFLIEIIQNRMGNLGSALAYMQSGVSYRQEIDVLCEYIAELSL